MSNNICVTLVGLSFWPARGVMSPARAACICHPASRTLQRGAGGKTLFEHQCQWFGNPLPGRTLSSQLRVVAAAAAAMEKSTAALVESPTGTGKTFGLQNCV